MNNFTLADMNTIQTLTSWFNYQMNIVSEIRQAIGRGYPIAVRGDCGSGKVVMSKKAMELLRFDSEVIYCDRLDAFDVCQFLKSSSTKGVILSGVENMSSFTEESIGSFLATTTRPVVVCVNKSVPIYWQHLITETVHIRKF